MAIDRWTQSIQPSDFITKSTKHMNIEFVGFSYGHAIFSFIDTSCITIVDVFTSASVSPPLCPSLFSMASRYGYYNDQIYFGITAAMHRPMHASLSPSFMAYLFGGIESDPWQKGIYTSYHQQLPIKQNVTFKGQIIGMGIGERLYGVHLDAPQLGIIVEELPVWENAGFGEYKVWQHMVDSLQR
jgi:hypothetical protein